MSAPKTLGRWGLLAKIEAAYGTYNQPAAATDGILVVQRPDVELGYGNDGRRHSRRLKNVPKSGGSGKVTLAHEPAGLGIAYTATKAPSPHLLLRGAGFDAASDLTVGQEKYTYTLTPEGSYSALSLEPYYRGMYAKLAGCYADTLKISAAAGEVPLMEFAYQGILQQLPQDLALPQITYLDAQLVDPPKAAGLNLVIGTFTPIRVKSYEFNLSRHLGERALDNVTGKHGGFTPGSAEDVEVSLTTVIEATALEPATPWHTAGKLNPYQLNELASALGVSLQIGATQYKRWKISAAAAQLMEDPEQDENNAALWSLTWDLKPSGFDKFDHVQLVWD